LSINISEGCLVVPIQGEIDDERISRIQKEILESVLKMGTKGVVIDLSGVKIIEPYHAQIIDNTAKMIYLLGARTVLTGIRPGVAISLTDSNFEFKEIYGTAGTFEDGVKKLQSVVGASEKLESEKFEEEIEKEIVEEIEENEIEVEEEREAEKEDSYESVDIEEEKKPD
jgi:rsbT antagonist protein RsbS